MQSTPGGSGLGAWITYEGMWYDDAGRLVTTADVGTNGGVGWSMPATAPTVSSATDEVTVDGYNQQGEQSTVTDPDGYITNTTFDGLGRKLSTVEDATGSATPGNGSAAQNKTTTYTYGPAGQTTLTAFDNGVGQTTQYVYGVSTATGSTINSNDIVGVTEYPDPTTGQPSTASNEEETVTVDAEGQTLSSTDRNGTTHAYTYDPLGRELFDNVITLGAGVNGTVLSIGTQYDSQGNAYLVTSYSGMGGTGTIVNQVERLYDGFGDVTAEYQSVNGAVTIGSTPVVQYSYSDGANNSDALTGTVYPDGYTVTDNYAGTTDTAISRLSSLSDSSGNVESYTYQGVSTVLGRSQAVQSLSTTLDNFGNVAEQKWTSGTTTNSDYQYTYDSDNNVLNRADQANSALSQTYTYDGLNQLTAYTEGGDGAQSYGYDSLGNRTSVTTGTGSPVTWAANEQNEITNAGAGTTTPVYDHDGNMTTDQNGATYTWDAWNRLISVTSGATVETFTYDADSRLVTDTVGGVATNRFYSKQDEVLEEQSGGNWTARYVWSPVYVNALIFRDTPASGTQVWAEQDANYNVVVLVGASGAVVERFDYTAFGVQTATGSVVNWAYGWQGMRLDSVTGWVESESRWYSPALGVWTSVDPLGFGGGDVREYGFEGNNGILRADPSGHAEETTRAKQNGMYVGMSSDGEASTNTNVREVSRSSFQSIMETGNVAPVKQSSVNVSAIVIAYSAGWVTEAQIKDQNVASSKKWIAKFADLTPNEQAALASKLSLEKTKTVINDLSDATINSLRLDAGCIGLVSCYIQSASQFRKAWGEKITAETNVNDAFQASLMVQDLPGAQYYSKLADAKAQLQKQNGASLIAVQGIGTGTEGALPQKLKGDSIITNNPRYPFNFAIYFPSTQVWAYMNQGTDPFAEKPADQVVYLSKNDVLPDFRSTMYVVIPSQVKK